MIGAERPRHDHGRGFRGHCSPRHPCSQQRPSSGQAVRSSRVDRAAGIVALTLERSFTLASRQRRPVTVSCDCVNQAIEIRDLANRQSLPASSVRAVNRVPARHAAAVRWECNRVSHWRGDISPHRADRRWALKPAGHSFDGRAGAGGPMTSDRLDADERAGFSLIEAMVTLSLLCFVVAVLGPLLLAGLTAVQRRHGKPVQHRRHGRGLISRHDQPHDQLTAGCIVDTTTAFRHTTCSVLTDTLPTLRRVRIVVTPDDSLTSGPDTVTIYRFNAQFTNPFDTRHDAALVQAHRAHARRIAGCHGVTAIVGAALIQIISPRTGLREAMKHGGSRGRFREGHSIGCWRTFA